jgi:hypothetical protein
VRFLADGPSIPDELLVARDEGRVLFFCGAGVSRAKANLPGFLRLAERVLEELRALPESPPRKLVEVASRLEQIAGVGGILAADRIFGLLERDFALADIDRAVGRALRPPPGVNLAAHRTVLDLCRSTNGDVHLVTTNFDLLFEAAAPKLRRWTPNDLPDLRRSERIHGIVHLHGMFDDDYVKPVGGNLVLSSAEFGRAYLSEGWATRFIRSAIERYLVVFIGYTADDPPVQYLLEALNRAAAHPPRGLYAFQAGREDEARALWMHKGVTAIPYVRGNDHTGLWGTLAAWSERARDPDRWRTRLTRRARRGPEAMPPHERGQVVHLAATTSGARHLAKTKTPIPASWLCVFDPACRYETPGVISVTDALARAAPNVDPFISYGLDSDPVPPRLKENEVHKRREVPMGVIDALAPLPLDGLTENAAGFRGERSNVVAPLTPRLSLLAVWFGRVCGQPAALWWASGQSSLHPIVMRTVQFNVDARENKLPPMARKAWRYLFEACDGPGRPALMEAYTLNERLGREGWTSLDARNLAGLLRPRLTVGRPYGVMPPNRKTSLKLRDLIRLDVEYPTEEIPVEIRDDGLPTVLPLLRRNLEDASSLEAEVNPFSLENIPPL